MPKILQKPKADGSRVFAGLAALALAGTVSGTQAQSPAGAPQRDLVLEGATLIDGTGKAPLADSVIVIEGNRIKAVGRRGQVPIPANARIVPVNGRTILPGLIDAHVHLQEWQVPMFLPYGVTTIADLNNDTAWILAQREALKSGKIKGPRLFVSGAMVYGTLGSTSMVFNTAPVRSVEDARARVRSLVAAGVDIIKVNNDITDDQLKAVIEEANAAGLPAVGHTRDIRKAAEMGFKFEEHLDTMARALLDPQDKISPKLYPPPAHVVALPEVTFESQVDPKQFPPLVNYLVSQGVFLNPTLGSGWVTADKWAWDDRAKTAAELAKDPALAFVPAAIRNGVWTGDYQRPAGPPRGGYDNVKEYVREYAQAGGKLVVGTDTGADPDSIPGQAVYEEMQMLVNVGVPPMKAIEAATLWDAEAIKKDKEIGSVEAGKLADLVVIAGDPLTDMSAVKNVKMVIKDGQVMDTAYDPKWVNPIPQPYITDFHARPLQITQLSTRTAHQGDPALTLEVNGTSFAPDAVVRFDDADLPTKFVSGTKLTATVDARFFRDRGSYPVYVINPGPHGTLSPAQYFVVDFKK